MRVAIDDRAVQRALEALGKTEARASASRAIRRAATTVQTEARKVARAELNLRATPINEAVRATGRQGRKGGESIYEDVRVKAKPIKAVDYLGERQTKLGVTVQFLRSRGRRLLPGTFIARMATGHVGIFVRRRSSATRDRSATPLRGSIKHRGTTYRPELPIRELEGKAVVSVINDPTRLAALLGIAKARMIEVMRQEIRFRISKRAERALR